jgi:ABC transporter DrrB family efflux protein
MSAVVLETRGLTRRFGERVAVRGVDLAVERGAIFGLLGPNGSGKSTIIRMLCGVLAPTAGEGRVLGFDCERDAESVKQRIGYMSQKFSLYGDLSVRENLEFYGRIYRIDAADLARRVDAALALTSLADRTEQLAETLSGGWKQRLALGCALIHEPELVFLDEPTAGIDPVARRELWDLLFDLSARGVTLFVTTHYMDEAERCTDVGYIQNGSLVVCGKPHELKALPHVTPAGTRRLELSCDAPATKLAALRAVPGVADATLFGQTVHVLVEDRADDAKLLAAAGAGSSAREIAPSLEDVFVTLSKRENDEVSPRRHGDHGEHGEHIENRSGTAGRPAAEPPSGRPLRESPCSPCLRGEGRSEPSPRKPGAMDGFVAILRKEFAHLRRQPSTIFFLLVIPLVQTLIFGYAIDTQIEHVPTVVYDVDGRAPARELVEAFENTRTFRVIERVHDEESFERAIRSGRAKVGIKVPPDLSDRRVSGESAQVLVLVDGSDAQVATTALTAANLLGLRLSLEKGISTAESLSVAPARDAAGRFALPLEVRPRLLFNPDLESSRFFVPGLVGIILQLVTLFLSSFAIVREREMGTLEQLFVTPVGRAGLVLGKLAPYALVGFVETLIVLVAMVFVFGVPIAGSLTLLLSLSALFIVCSLGMGLFVSTVAKTQAQAFQFAFIVMLPSILLSGFMFPRAEMPTPIYLATFAIPATHFLEILRGVVLRGADLVDLLPSVQALAVVTALVLAAAVARFTKTSG